MTLEELQRLYNRSQLGNPLPRGTVVTPGDDSTSYVAEDPRALAAAAELDVEVYSAARLIASEGYAGGAPRSSQLRAVGFATAMAAIVEVARNEARARGTSLTRLLTRHKSGDERDGHYGRQSGRYAASLAGPTSFHVAVAKASFRGDLPKLVSGARQFFDPRTQDGGRQAGKPICDAAGLLRCWHGFEQCRASDGKVHCSLGRAAWIGPVAGLSSYDLMFLVPEDSETYRRRTLEKALAVVAAKDDAPAAGRHYRWPWDDDTLGALLSLAASAGKAALV